MVKLSKNRGGTGSVSYSISISGKEATRAGLWMMTATLMI